MDKPPEVPESQTFTLGDPRHDHYPKQHKYPWGAFAYLAVEAGGYGDLEAVNPFNGDRLNVPVFKLPGGKPGQYNWNVDDANLSPYDGLRRLIDAMEAAHFFELRIPPDQRAALLDEQYGRMNKALEDAGITLPPPPPQPGDVGYGC